jgi:hypothetical protein
MQMMEAILSWIRSAYAIGLAVAATGMATEAIANSVVVRSTGPSAKSYPPGKALAANTKLALKAGDIVTVLDAGGTRVLRGPGSVSISSPTTATGSAINSLLRNTNGRQARTGATRGTGQTAVKRPNLWLIDAASGGTMCLEDLSMASFWRPRNAAPQTLAVSADGKTANVKFSANQTVATWPIKDLPIAEGKDYSIVGAGTAPVTLRFAKVPASEGNPTKAAGALISKGCNGQLDLLVDTGTPPPEAG